MATSARKENRWRKTLYAANTTLNDRQRELEAAFMVRAARPAPMPPPGPHTRREVRRWMRANAADYETATALAEAANAALRLPVEAMDDGSHWVWDEALSALE